MGRKKMQKLWQTIPPAKKNKTKQTTKPIIQNDRDMELLCYSSSKLFSAILSCTQQFLQRH